MADEDTPEDGEESESMTEANVLISYMENPFWQGFQWALKVADAKNGGSLERQLQPFLRELAAGEATLLSTPEEAVKEYQALGLEEGLEGVRRLHSGDTRRELEADDRKKAAEYVKILDLLQK